MSASVTERGLESVVKSIFEAKFTVPLVLVFLNTENLATLLSITTASDFPSPSISPITVLPGKVFTPKLALAVISIVSILPLLGLNVVLKY